MNYEYMNPLKEIFLSSGKMLMSLISTFMLLSCAGKTVHEEEVVQERPNIVIIMADDMGYSDLGSYGGEIETPNLDKLASQGVLLTSFYNTARCVPSRGALLTGLYPHQAGVGRMTRDQDLPGYKGTISQSSVTIAEVLKQKGYHTGMTGKWHLSPTEVLENENQLKWLSHNISREQFSRLDTYPTSRGFDNFYGNIWGVVDYFDPFSLVNGTEPVENVPKDFYYTDAIGDTAVAYVERFSKKKEPFFLYVAHTAPHWPLQAPEKEIKKYDSIYKKGWRTIRNLRYQNLIKKGILSTDKAELSKFMFPELSWDENPDKEWDSRAMAVHAAMVDRMDQNIGNLIKKLEETGELENTVIFFLSDNGASSERPSRYGPGFDRAGSTRDGKKVVFPVKKDSLPGYQTVHSGIGPQWSHVANTPFRYWKGKVYEGGISSPFLVHWPAGLGKPGRVESAAAHIIDIMATCLDLAGAEYPETYKGKKITSSPGHSIVPILKDSSEADTQDTYFWEHMGSAAIREGSWKLVRLRPGADWKLYDLSNDRTEVQDLSREFPEKVSQLKEKWMEMAYELKVYPSPNQRKEIIL